MSLEQESLVIYLLRQMHWSNKTFGPGHRTKGIIDHIKKELREIEENPLDVEEWVDIVILGLDGAWRTGASVTEVMKVLLEKQDKNRKRKWPDWRGNENNAIEHIRN